MTHSSADETDNELCRMYSQVVRRAETEASVFDFLSEYEQAPLADKLSVCLADLAERWRSGDSYPVEGYVDGIPELKESSDAIVTLMVGEYHCQTEQGIVPDLEEFLERFPAHRTELFAQLRTRLLKLPTLHDNQTPAGGVFGEATETLSQGNETSTVRSNASIPQYLGKFRVDRTLGNGGFGVVYLAFDEELQRAVAIKVPHLHRLQDSKDVDAYFEEARILASLDHASIVPLYDFDRTEDGRCYSVSKFVEGCNLAEKCDHSEYSFDAAVAVIVSVAEALQYSHSHGVIHRDIKPANILIDREGKPYVTDFGLALKEDNWGKVTPTGGTPAYMSPEQVRREGHLVDGRTDVFSLAVVFYELLTRERAFGGTIESRRVSNEFRPPREINPAIPPELERICLKAMSLRTADRYQNAGQFADDLRHFAATNSGGQAGVVHSRLADAAFPGIVPRGLRAFCGEDADFYPGLLPGPRGRDGLPECIRFWLTRIQSQGVESTFRVGVIYGPSGCGKSSFLKAGVLPHLSASVVPIYIEATADETDARLLRALRSECPELPSHLDLAETMVALRCGQGLPNGKKVLIIIDQFEQWLHAHRQTGSAQLVDALRQCDGIHVQCVLTARDDFWMAISQFMELIGVPLATDHNIASLDLFGIHHTEKILTALGRAYGALPADNEPLEAAQLAFVRSAAQDLAIDDQVIPVQLILFAEMVKDKPWNSQTLKELGGIDGVGVTFLEETFNGRSANLQHRIHQKGAKSVLALLLADNADGIRGGKRSYEELLDGAGYCGRQEEFDALLKILDSDLRLLTPTIPLEIGVSEIASDDASGKTSPRYYQLTHDYLVPSIANWLFQDKKTTGCGRAELLLSERAKHWNARPSNRTLPSLIEWSRILAFVPRNLRSRVKSEEAMMARAGRVHLIRISFVVLALLCGGLWLRDAAPRSKSASIIDSLQVATTEDVPQLVERLVPIRRWANPLLKKAIEEVEVGSRAELHLQMAILPTDAGHQKLLCQQILNAPVQTVEIVARHLSSYGDPAQNLDFFRPVLTDYDETVDRRLRAAAALSCLPSGRVALDSFWDDHTEFLANELIARTADSRELFKPWTSVLFPIRQHLVPHLSAAYASDSLRDAETTIAAYILAEYLHDQPHQIVDLLVDAGPDQHNALFPKLDGKSAEVGGHLRKMIEEVPTSEDVYDKYSAVCKRRAHAAALLFATGETNPSWQIFQDAADLETAAFLECRLAELVVGADSLCEELQSTSSATLQAAIIRTLGEIDLGNLRKIPPRRRKACIACFESMHRSSPDAGVHSAAAWALRSWGEQARLDACDASLAVDSMSNDQNWFRTQSGNTMVVLRGPIEYRAGSPKDEPGRDASDEGFCNRKINRDFAICVTEVTREQYVKFDPDFKYGKNSASLTDDSAVGSVTWQQAAAYCLWLSQQEGMPESQWCYSPVTDSIVHTHADCLERTGYRLPTEAEWEYACRAGSNAVFSWGATPSLGSRYSWHSKNSDEHLWPVGVRCPNRFGLFDMHGNAEEWTSGWYKPVLPVDGATPTIVRDDPLRQTHKATRGGSSETFLRRQRSANRFPRRLRNRTNRTCGLRIVRTLPPSN